MLLLKSAKNVTRYVGIISQADGKLHAEAFGTSLQASGTLQYMAKLSGSQKRVPTSSLHRERKRCQKQHVSGASLDAWTWWESSCDGIHFVEPAVNYPQVSSKSAGPHKAVSVTSWIVAVLLPSILWFLIHFHHLPCFMVVTDKIN